MPELTIRRASRSEVVLVHGWLGGWVVAAIGAAIAWAGWTLVDDGPGRWLLAGTASVFTLIGAGGGLWRHELTLEPLTGRYRGRRGFWPSPARLEGSLDELSGVALTRSWRRSKNTSHAVWVVNLVLASRDRPLSIYETSDEAKAYRKQEALARLLQVDAIDRTGETERRRAHDELDRAVGDRALAGPATAGPPPAASGIELVDERGARTILLPAAGFGLGTAVVALFGLPFAGFGLLALASLVGVAPLEVEGTTLAKWLVGTLFTLFGLAMSAGAVFGAVARETVRDDGDALVVALAAFGRSCRRRRLAKREIESIGIGETDSARGRRPGSRPLPTEVVVRTDAAVVRLAAGLPRPSQAWLVETLTGLARR